MKTYNVLPYAKEKNSSSVYQTAKIKDFIKKNKPDILSNSNTKPIAVVDEENLKQEERATPIIEDRKTESEKTVDFGEQAGNGLIEPHESQCIKCHCDLNQIDFDRNRPYVFSGANPSKKDPRAYKNLPFSSTKSIPSAGKNYNKSESSYHVIFGEA